MTDLLAQAASWLESQRQAFLSRNVVYARGDYQATVAATPGRSEFDVDNGNGIYTRLETHDEIINVAQLILNGVAVEPQAGDTITDGDLTFQVRDVGNQPCWRFSDQYRLSYRIHTKLINDET